MASQNDIYLLTRDADTAQAVSEVLSGGDSQTNVTVCREFVTLLGHLARAEAAIVVVDVDAEPMAMLEELEPIANQYVRTRFIVLASQPSGELVIRAMQVGVRHVQVKATLTRELAAAVQRLLPSTETFTGRMGMIVPVFSAGGGCGGTTLAVNLAHELRLTTQERVLLVDMDYAYGAVATYLELKGQYGIADILSHTGVIDAHLVRSTALHCAGGYQALLSPASIRLRSVRPISTERLDAALTACRQGFAYTVIDAPRITGDVAGILARAAEQILVVMQPSVKDIRMAKEIMAELVEEGASHMRIRPVMNRCRHRRQMIPVEEAQKVLGVNVAQFTNDYESAIRSINYGQTLADAAPRSILRKEVAQWASQLAGQHVGNGKLKR